MYAGTGTEALGPCEQETELPGEGVWCYGNTRFQHRWAFGNLTFLSWFFLFKGSMHQRGYDSIKAFSGVVAEVRAAVHLGAIWNGWPAFGSGRVAAKRLRGMRATTRLVSTSGNKIREGATMNAIERPGSGIVPRNDLDRFRLRRFIDDLAGTGEIEMREAPVDLADIAEILDGNPQAVHFHAVGPERQELVGNVLSSRARVARAFGVAPERLAAEIAAPARQQAGDRRGDARRGAGAAGRADRRRRRPHDAAGASAARARRRRPTSRPRSTTRSIRTPAGPMSASAG